MSPQNRSRADAGIHVAEQVAVYGLQVAQIKAAFKERLGKFSGPLRHEVGFCRFKQRLVRNSEAVF